MGSEVPGTSVKYRDRQKKTHVNRTQIGTDKDQVTDSPGTAVFPGTTPRNRLPLTIHTASCYLSCVFFQGERKVSVLSIPGTRGRLRTMG